LAPRPNRNLLARSASAARGALPPACSASTAPSAAVSRQESMRRAAGRWRARCSPPGC
jgi:hypothetical protein